MENEVKISIIEVQKELMKNKVMANLSHYCQGNMYYTVELESGKYQFPISTVDTGKISEMIPGKIKTNTTHPEKAGYEDVSGLYLESEIDNALEEARRPEEVKITRLSEDLGMTTFSAEMKGSLLNRWVKKAIEKDEFVKVG